MMKPIIEKFAELTKGVEITKQEGNFSLILFAGCIGGCFPPYISRYYDKDFGSLVFIMHGRHGLVLFDLSKYMLTTSLTYKRYREQKNECIENKDFKEIWKITDDLYAKYTNSKIEKLSEIELDGLIKQVFSLYHKLLAATVFCESLNEGQVKKYYKEISNDSDKFEQFFQIASRPVFDSFVLRMDLGLCDKKHDPDNLQYLFADYYVVPPVETVELEAKKIIANRGGIDVIQKEVNKIKAELAENKKIVAEYRKNLPTNLQTLLDFIQFAMYIRDIRKEPMQKFLALSCNVARAIFSNLGIDRDDIVYSVYQDYETGFYKKPEYKKEIIKRKNEGVVSFFSAEGIDFEYGDIDEKRNQFFALMDRGSGEVKEIKGNLAFTGKVKAKAQIILSDKDFDKFKDGSVLVTSMTRPEFVPLMKKASAVITDEGGITCHAAIISRELKKPCITGTKNATRILHDGDMVEVDADNGIVKIISHA